MNDTQTLSPHSSLKKFANQEDGYVEVTIRLPIGPCAVGMDQTPRRADVQNLPDEMRVIWRRLWQGCRNQNVSFMNGKPVSTYADSLKFVLEVLAAAVDEQPN